MEAGQGRVLWWLGWIGAVIFLFIGGIGVLTGDLPAFLLVLLGLWMLPPLRTQLKQSYPVVAKPLVAWGVGLSLFFLFGVFVEPDTQSGVESQQTIADQKVQTPATAPATSTPSKPEEPPSVSTTTANNETLAAVDRGDVSTSGDRNAELAAAPTTDASESISEVVLDVVDGDTVKLGNGATVRLIGINSPERGEPYYTEAADELRTLVLNKEVRLEQDVSERDQYGRLLAYVYVGDMFVNETIVRRGFAKAYPYEPDISKQSALRAAEQAAQTAAVGMWQPPDVATEETVTDEVSLAVVEFNYDSPGNDNDTMTEEYFVLENKGSIAVELDGFKASDAANHTYTFSDFALASGAQVTIRTGTGRDTSSDLYWGNDGAVWNNGGDTLYLHDSAGSLVLTYSY